MASSNGGGLSSNIFAQNSGLGGIFGATSQTASNPSPLGQVTNATTTPTEATTPNTQGLLGAGQSTKLESGSLTPSLFGKTAATTGGLFSIPSTTASSFSFGVTSATTTNTENKPQTTSGLFGSFQASSNPPAFGTSSAGTSTPAKPFSLNSTTPIGPPPKENGQEAKESIFGAGTSSKGSAIFGNTGLAPNSNMFNKEGSLFSNIKSSAPSTSESEVPKVTLSAPSDTSATIPSSQASASAPMTTSTKFGGTGASTSSLSTTATKPDLFGGLGNTSKPQSTTSIGTTSSAPGKASTLFGSFGNTPKIPTTSSIGGFMPASSSEPKSTTPGTSTPVASSTSTTAAPVTNQNLATESKAESNPGLTSSVSAGVLPLGSSTVGPTPQLTRLKNKTMDEIITRWASDLSKYQKEFQEQAGKVAAWDRLMVENGEKIQKLYLSTFEAERQNAEIERQLLNVESQQDEVASWLDKYESEIDEMFSRQVGQDDSLQGPDQERERTYKLAEKLTDRLDEMGKNLASMIDAINDASTTLTKTGKPDDPLSSILRVLNNHLTTLQWIDENAEALKHKIMDAQKIAQNIGSNENGRTDSKSAEYFYRSLIGRK
ncbi:hypothetical protein K3495_g9548 [Podosphaera aphanis]|nr:hypothetical protein K3495_g9548 [Podosphaera aphanis]